MSGLYVVTVSEAMERAGLSRTAIMHHLHKGHFGAEPMPDAYGRLYWAIDRESFDAWLTRRAVDGRTRQD